MKERTKKSLIIIVIGLAVNIALSLVKLYVGLSSNSLTILLDATNNFFDILTCIVTIVAFIILLKPQTENASFGYGRGEYLAGFIIAVVSVVVGGLFFIRSINRLAMPEPIWYSWQSCVLISVAIPVKLGLGLCYYFENKKIKSKAIKSLVLDSFLDTAVTATSLVSFAISSKIDYAADAIFGIVMSIVIVVFAIKVVIDNIKAVVLGDGIKDVAEKITDEVEKTNLIGVDKIILHDYGYMKKIGNVYITIKDDQNADEILDKLKEQIKNDIGAEIEFIEAKNNGGKDGREQ